MRVWHAASGKELLRIAVPNLLCNALEITPDGKAIVTGQSSKTQLYSLHVLFINCSIMHFLAWDDGKIRTFFPESGKPAYTIHDAHGKGVTALAVTSNSRRIISGGGEGQVRVWDISQHYQTMKTALKEHKGEW